MIGHISQRLIQGLVVIAGAVGITFGLAAIAGGPGELLAGGFRNPIAVKAINHQYGFDQPPLQRFVHYAIGAARGDFGESFRTHHSAMGDVLAALPYTAELVACTISVVCLLGIPIAVFSVLHRDSRIDRSIRALLIVGQGIPEFWLAILLVLWFAVGLHWLPSINEGTARSLILPVATLSVPLLSTLVRIVRAELLGAMGKEFTTALRAKGLRTRTIVWRHGMRNAMGPTVTFLALQLGWLVGGTLVVEYVFGWPGIGNLAASSVAQRDLPVVQAIVVLVAACYVLLNLAADVFVLWLDPRVRTVRA